MIPKNYSSIAILAILVLFPTNSTTTISQPENSPNAMIQESIAMNESFLTNTHKSFVFQNEDKAINNLGIFNTLPNVNYTEREAIHIDSNSDFISYGFNGSGTINDPYLIENYNITSTNTAIAIINVNSYFVIQNNFLDGLSIGPHGIYIENADNGVLLNNYIKNAQYDGINIVSSDFTLLINNTVSFSQGWGGINLFNSYFTLVERNIAFSNNGNGIILEQSHHTTIRNNIAYKNAYPGIRLSTANYSLIESNDAYLNNESGIWLFESSYYNTIQNNNVYQNKGEGILIRLSGNNSISGNNVWENNYTGIGIEDSDHNSVFDNNIKSGSDLGIDVGGISGSDFNPIYSNILYDNSGEDIRISNGDYNTIYLNDMKGPRTGPQATDYGTNTNFTGNFYNDWDWSGPYEIGGAGGEDIDVKDIPNHIAYNGPPVLFVTGSTITSDILISWEGINDDHEMKFAVYYQTLPINQFLWTLISDNITENSLVIKTSSLPIGDELQFQVRVLDSLGFEGRTTNPNIYTVETPPTIVTTVTVTITTEPTNQGQNSSVPSTLGWDIAHMMSIVISLIVTRHIIDKVRKKSKYI